MKNKIEKLFMLVLLCTGFLFSLYKGWIDEALFFLGITCLAIVLYVAEQQINEL